MGAKRARAVTLAATLAWAAGTAAVALDGELASKVQQYNLSKLQDGTVYLNIDRAARAILGDGLSVRNEKGNATGVHPQLAPLVEALAERVPEGGAIHFGDLGRLIGERGPAFDLRRIRDRIAITGNAGIVLGGGQKGLQVLCGPNVEIRPSADGRSGPLEDLTMLFGHCGRISGDVKGSDFIAAVNGWASYAFKAEARIDDTLFLWFSRNWTFADYNAHLKDSAQEWWKKNCQAYFDLKGGGKGTRVYLMIETDYGNPGVGVWLRDCDGLAMYHGATERGSSQGPGCYYLQNCRNVQLGLRRIFPGSRGGGQSAMPAHGITVEGGSGNILHFLTDFSNSYEESLVNSDPRLQMWGTEFDFDTRGADAADILRFCYTPRNNVPQGANAGEAAKLADREAANWVRQRNQKSGLPDTPENVEKLKALIRSGRDQWWPLNATKGKKIKGGYIGSAQQVQDVAVDVALVDGAPAVTLRSVRNSQTARANGHILMNVKANGPLAFINDSNAHNDLYRKTFEQRDSKRVKPDGAVDLNWDANASAHELAPPNGWVHPFLFYNCTFGDRSYAYSLVNADMSANKQLAAVDLAPLAR